MRFGGDGGGGDGGTAAGGDEARVNRRDQSRPQQGAS
jgi:hypothetical protein